MPKEEVERMAAASRKRRMENQDHMEEMQQDELGAGEGAGLQGSDD